MEVACIQTAVATDPLCPSQTRMWPLCAADWDSRLAQIALWVLSRVRDSSRNNPGTVWQHCGLWAPLSRWGESQLPGISQPVLFAAEVQTPKWSQRDRSSHGGIGFDQQQTMKIKCMEGNRDIAGFHLFCSSKCQILVVEEMCTLQAYANVWNSSFDKNPFIHCHCLKKAKNEMHIWSLCNYLRIYLYGYRRLL